MVVDAQHSSSPTTTSVIISIIHSPINPVNGFGHATLFLLHNNKCHHLYHTLVNQCSQWLWTRNTLPLPQQQVSSCLSYTRQSMQSMVLDTQHSSSPTTTSVIMSIIHSPINPVNGFGHATLFLLHNNKCHHLYHRLVNQCSQWLWTRNTLPLPQQQVSSCLSYTRQSMQSMVLDTQHSSSPTTTSVIMSIIHSPINPVNGFGHATLFLLHNNKCHHLYHTLVNQCSQWLWTRNTLPLPQQQVSSCLSYTRQSMQSMVLDTQHSSSPTTTSVIMSIIHSPINAVNGCSHATLFLSHNNKCHHIYHTLANQCSQWLWTRNTLDAKHPTTTSVIISIIHSPINTVNGC